MKKMTFGNLSRRALFFRLASMLCLLPLQACSALDVLNAAIPEEGYRLFSDISYGSKERQNMDIYVPSSPTENSQVVVFVYGGAWRSGEKADYEFVGQALSSAGHTVVIPDYRLYPQVVFPDFVTDVAMAITSLNRQSFNQSDLPAIDFSSVVLMGHSSGAHSAALITTDARYINDSDVKVTGLIALAGPYDLPLKNEEVAPVFEPADEPRQTNPTLLASAEHPVTLLIHGSEDERVEPWHSQRYFDVLQSLNVSSKLLMVEGSGHAAIVAAIATPLQATNDVMPTVLSFLEDI